MLERFLRRFVPNYESVEDPAVRKAYGTFSSVVGICCNVVLFLLKYVMGSISYLCCLSVFTAALSEKAQPKAAGVYPVFSLFPDQQLLLCLFPQHHMECSEQSDSVFLHHLVLSHYLVTPHPQRFFHLYRQHGDRHSLRHSLHLV